MRPLQNLIPGGFHSRRQAAKISSREFPWNPRCHRPPRNLRTVIPNHGRGPYTPPSSPTRVDGTVDNADLIPKLAMPFLNLQQCHRPRVHDAVHPTLSPSPRCPEPTTLSSSPGPQGYIVYFSLSFWAYKS
jgi:hypothetical protein